MKLPESLRLFGDETRNHPWAVVAGIVVSLVVFGGVVSLLLYFGHDEREHRQQWIETKFETLVMALNALQAETNEALHDSQRTDEDIQRTLVALSNRVESLEERVIAWHHAVLQELEAEGRDDPPNSAPR